jgi:hypothetical protein
MFGYGQPRGWRKPQGERALRKLLWVKLELPAVEQDCDAVVFEGAEAAGAGLDHLDLQV